MKASLIFHKLAGQMFQSIQGLSWQSFSVR